jgi:hypothetical protein
LVNSRWRDAVEQRWDTRLRAQLLLIVAGITLIAGWIAMFRGTDASFGLQSFFSRSLQDPPKLSDFFLATSILVSASGSLLSYESAVPRFGKLRAIAIAALLSPIFYVAASLAISIATLVILLVVGPVFLGP